MRSRTAWWATLVVGAALWPGCSQTSSIQALPPRPAMPVDSVESALADAGLARLDVRLQIGGTELPDEVSSLRFRPTEI